MANKRNSTIRRAWGAALAVVLAGCGGAGDSEPSSPGATRTGALRMEIPGPEPTRMLPSNRHWIYARIDGNTGLTTNVESKELQAGVTNVVTLGTSADVGVTPGTYAIHVAVYASEPNLSVVDGKVPRGALAYGTQTVRVTAGETSNFTIVLQPEVDRVKGSLGTRAFELRKDNPVSTAIELSPGTYQLDASVGKIDRTNPGNSFVLLPVDANGNPKTFKAVSQGGIVADPAQKSVDGKLDAKIQVNSLGSMLLRYADGTDNGSQSTVEQTFSIPIQVVRPTPAALGRAQTDVIAGFGSMGTASVGKDLRVFRTGGNFGFDANGALPGDGLGAIDTSHGRFAVSGGKILFTAGDKLWIATPPAGTDTVSAAEVPLGANGKPLDVVAHPTGGFLVLASTRSAPNTPKLVAVGVDGTVGAAQDLTKAFTAFDVADDGSPYLAVGSLIYKGASPVITASAYVEDVAVSDNYVFAATVSSIQVFGVADNKLKATLTLPAGAQRARVSPGPDSTVLIAFRVGDTGYTTTLRY